MVITDKNWKALSYLSLFTNLDAQSIMERDVITLKASDEIRKAKEIMKEKRISGIPIVDDENRLIGIISVADIIDALESDLLDSKIEVLMTRSVKILKPTDSFEVIASYFQEYGFGRFPVVDKDNKLIGIVTETDILSSMVRSFYSVYVHDKRRTDVLGSYSGVLDAVSAKTDFEFEIKETLFDTGKGSTLLKTELIKKGYDPDFIRRISIATYEAEVNVVLHARGKGKINAYFKEDMVVVVIQDEGPGIDDIDLAMKEGYSTAPDSVRELGFGAGMGLPNIRRFTDHLVVISGKNKPTKLEMVFTSKPQYEKK